MLPPGRDSKRFKEVVSRLELKAFKGAVAQGLAAREGRSQSSKEIGGHRPSLIGIILSQDESAGSGWLRELSLDDVELQGFDIS